MSKSLEEWAIDIALTLHYNPELTPEEKTMSVYSRLITLKQELITEIKVSKVNVSDLTHLEDLLKLPKGNN